MKVLIIDDDETDAELILLTFEEIANTAETDIEIDIMGDANKPIACFDPYHIIAVDYRLPGKTGAELASELLIRSDNQHSMLQHVILISGLQDTFERDDVKMLDYFVAKGLLHMIKKGKPRELIHKIMELSEQR